MEAKFFLLSKTIWGMGIVNIAIVVWNSLMPNQQVTVDQSAAINAVLAIVFRSVTTTPVKLLPGGK